MADLDELCGRVLGEFVLRERIDEGGFGTVYRSEQPLLGREVVVKVLRQRVRRRDVATQRFLREAKLASRLDHPYAAHVYALGVEPDDGVVWIAMELVNGVTLSRWLQTRGPLPLEQFVPFFEKVAEVVHVAHEHGIVHRDLKSSNIMVIERAGSLLPKLLDFGVATLRGEAPLSSIDDAEGGETDAERTAPIRRRPTSTLQRSRLTPAGAAIGSPPYMAPELWAASVSAGPASDLYALGVVAYEALTGARPFRADEAEKFAALHRDAPVPPIGGGFDAFDRVFQRALAKCPEERFGTALELAAALRAETEARMLARIRVAARQWHEHHRPAALLWRDDVLAELDRWLERSARAGTLNRLELEFAEASRERELAIEEGARRRTAWRRRFGIAAAIAAAATVIGVFQFRAVLETRTAQRIAAATAIYAEVEQGRAALLHDELPEAQLHLAEAYRRGDHSPATAFMLARASQPLRAEQARFAASSGRMWSAAWSPDGRRVVTSDDRGAQIWDAETRMLVATLPHGDTVHNAMFSPDGAMVVTAGNDGVVRLWAANDGGPLRELRPPRRGPASLHYFATAVSPDGRLVAAIDLLGEVAHVWDAASGAVVAELAGDASEWPSLAFSGDCRWLAVGGGNDVRVFDTRTWARAATIDGPRIRSVAWDPAGPRLVTGSADGDASIWAVPGGTRLKHLREIGEAVDAVAWAPDGGRVAAASRDGAEQVFDADSGRVVSQGNQLHGKMSAIEFDRSSQLLVAAGTGGAVAIGDAATGLPVSLLEGPRTAVRTAHFDPTSRRVLGASWDGTARIWDASSPYRRWSAPPISDDCRVVTSLEPDRRVVAIACRDRGTLVWDTAQERLLAELPAASFADTGVAILPAVSAAGDRAAIARGDVAEIYELPGGRLLRSVRHGAAVSALAFTATGDLATGAVDGSLLVTRDSGDPRALPGAPRGIDAIALLADGRLLAADGRRVRVIAVDSGAVLGELATPSRVGLLRPAASGDRLVVVPAVAATAPPTLWDLASYRAIARLEGHVGRVFSARWVSGDRVLTAGGDGAVRMWDASAKLLVTYRGGSRFLADAALSPDGELLVGGGADGLLRVWEAATGRPLWTTRAHIGALVGVHYEGEDVVTRGIGGDIARWRLSSN